jgi:biopolymer transport protein ExbD
MKDIIFRKAQTEEASINISPMIDMVFILLIFFVVTSVFVDELGFESTTPDSDKPLVESDPVRLEVNLDDNGEVRIRQEIVSYNRVGMEVRRLVATSNDYTVILSAMPKANAGSMTELLDVMRLAGATFVSLSLEG